MRVLSKEGVAVIPGDRMDATREKWVGETEASKMTCALLPQPYTPPRDGIRRDRKSVV